MQHLKTSYLLYVAIFSAIFLVSLGSQRYDKEDRADTSVCRKDRMKVTISFPGTHPLGYRCNTIERTLPYCTGKCNSLTRVTQDPPYVQQFCNCCSFNVVDVKSKHVHFECLAKSDSTGLIPKLLVARTVVFPRIRNCTCVECGQRPIIKI